MNKQFSLGQPVKPATGKLWEGHVIGIFDSFDETLYAVQRWFGRVRYYTAEQLQPIKQRPILVMLKGGKYPLQEPEECEMEQAL